MTTSPANINFKMYPHATFSETVTLTDSLGVPLDLTGKTGRCQIRREPEDAVALFTLTSSPAAGIEMGGVLGTITVTLTDEQTGSVAVDSAGESWVYDILVTHTPSGTAERVFQGIITVIPGVTLPT